MARRKSRTLTELELEIMHVVWDEKEVSSEVVASTLREKGQPLAPPSVRTMLGILQEKGYVSRRREGRGYVYSALVSANEARKSFLEDLMGRVFEGSPLTLLASLLGSGMVSKRDIQKVKQLIRKHEREDQ